MSISLPLLMDGHTRGKRSAVTCALKCANQCAGETCNTTDNGYFRDVASRALSRRAMLGGSTAGAIAIAVAGTAGQAPASAGTTSAAAPGQASAFGPLPASAPNGTALDFTAIDPVDMNEDRFDVPEGFEPHVVIKWGDKLWSDAPDFNWNAQTAEAQAKQFGYNNDYTEIQELPKTGGKRALMFVNHEYTNENIMFPATTDPKTVIEVGMAAHGLTVVELERASAAEPYAPVVDSQYNRRFLPNTTYRVTGPAAGSDLLKTAADKSGRKIQGTFGNCSGGLTPWGTLLSGEENFHGYFRSAGTSKEQKRYGLVDQATVRGWENEHPRFDTRSEATRNEENRFGWMVEVDPHDPTSTPRKHTAMGRFKHEGANVIVGDDGHVVAYMGDDEKFDYLYKFVSADKYMEGNRVHNMRLLESGDLYVAKFTGNSPAAQIDGSGKLPADGRFDGTGEWLPLTKDGKSVVDGFTIDEVLVYTRLAADAVGATKMDRCEDVEPSLKTGKVYVACTNNSDRGKAGKAGADEANPRTSNRDGHVVELTETGSQSGTTFGWSLLLVCGDPSKNDSTYFAGFPQDKVSPISCPDNVAFDSVGNLWISTDGAPSSIGLNDGLFRVAVEGPQRGQVEQFLSVPREAETCGPVVRDKDRTAFVAVQHPGENGSFEEPHSYWPEFQKTGPKPAIVQVLPVKKELAFSDVKPGMMFYAEIMWLAKKGITKGYPDGTFRPLAPVNRDAMAAYLHRLAGSPKARTPRNQPFKDVKPGMEHYEAIIWAVNEGIVKGWPDKTFRPTQPISREAMAAFLYRFAGSPSFAKPKAAPFKDVPLSNPFVTEIAWLKARGISTGWADGTYRPTSAINRDAMAAFLFRATEKKGIAFRKGA